MTVPVPTTRTWADAPSLTSILTYKEYGDSIFDVLDFLMNPPILHLRQTTAQNIPNITDTGLLWQTIVSDSSDIFVPTSTVIMPKVPGWYKGWIATSYAVSSSSNLGFRIMLLHKNTIPIRRREMRAAAYSSRDQVIKGIRFYVDMNGTTDYLQAVVWQNSGVTMQTEVDNVHVQPEFFMRWWAPL